MSRPTLTATVSAMISRDILYGIFQPGEKLSVAELKNYYQVGASPIREALMQLACEKYISLEPQKGARVASVSLNELHDLYQSLRTIAPTLLEQSMAYGQEEWELNVLSSFHQLSRLDFSTEVIDWSTREERQQKFHLSLLQAAHSTHMLNFFRDLANQIKRYRYFAHHQGCELSHFDTQAYEQLMKTVLEKNLKHALQEFDRQLSLSIKQIQPSIEKAA
ncbi:GntR family transcriptional regulator [Vibrio ostreicida]|uniref:GntR family transcriptional regulator n=1 Tax=Vibrio ostreicida TaxID=526588 RepID=A0ABT8BRE4_9VIBR|nr:GntR family transcriptional regulator [Vibrio ostreicida]MDN3608991.1 GntR family transcriptional regulator [Vibrio ostreicida]NPD07891.1 GntR family transcriptional regulator [Vibrio ostreicida]